MKAIKTSLKSIFSNRKPVCQNTGINIPSAVRGEVEGRGSEVGEGGIEFGIERRDRRGGEVNGIGVNPEVDGVVTTTPDFRVDWAWS